MKDLLTLADLTPEDLSGLLARAAELKAHPQNYIRALYEKTLLMIFEAPSLRTRLSFETAMTQLHGHAINYYTVHSPWGAGKESMEDVARTLSRYCNAVTARLYSHDELTKLAEHATVPVINAMTNEAHPCQAMADYLTIQEKRGDLAGMRVTYIGDACNNVAYSLMRAAALTSGELTIGCPDLEAYSPEARVIEEAAGLGCNVRVVHDAREAASGADVIYTDSWMSYRVPAEEKAKRLEELGPFRVDEAVMGEAKDDAIFMHCLPAWRGHEVTAGVIDGPHSVVFDQAENRMHTEKALLLTLIGEVTDLPGVS
ncbi:MAG: ornithine carbamoyltransferase [Planctomycetota bacterium]|nr:ornithine carbamoyltransferase [Planctomycetota bacterium]